MEITARIVSLLIGYFLGCFLTADLVARKYTGKSASELGTSKNPGMANVMANLGFRPGITVLAGDLGKCLMACLISGLLFGKTIGHICVFYAGFGATSGHCYPFWRRFRGGKGVATSSIALFLFSPLWGLLANIAGMLVVFATKYLCLGGAVIPFIFIFPAFLIYGTEAGVIAVVLALLCFSKHFPSIRTIPSGTCEKTDVIGAIRAKIGKRKDSK